MMKKRVLAVVLATTLAMASFTGCSNKEAAVEETVTEEVAEEATEEVVEEKVVEETTEASSEESPLEIKYAEYFDIEYMENDVKLVTDSEQNKLLLVPTEGEVPEGYDDVTVIRTPIDNVYYDSTTQVSFLQVISEELYSSIGAVSTEAALWGANPTVQGMIEAGDIQYIAKTHEVAANMEEVLTLAPQMVFSSGGDEAGVALRAQLDEVGIPYFLATDWYEATTEAYLEWLKLYAAFYNLDEEAAALFEGKLASMEELRIQAAEKTTDKLVVVSGMLYDGVVYASGKDSTSSKELEAAGAINGLGNVEGEGSVQINMEEFFTAAKDADVIIYNSMLEYTPNKQYLVDMDPLFAELKAFQNDNIYVMDNGYYMNAAQKDEKFEDIMAIVSPELLPDHELRHYVKLPE